MRGEEGRAVIGITCCTREDEDTHIHLVSDAYVRAVVLAIGGLPWPLPALDGPDALAMAGDWLDRIDGLIFTGSRSNIEPGCYDAPSQSGVGPFDPRRDRVTVPLMRMAIDAGVPVLAICRGLQEMNVAFGGTLHSRIHAVAGYADNRDPGGPAERMYAPAHPVRLEAGGVLAGRLGLAEVMVNSLHGQGIDRLGAGLAIEARAPDGLIEAVRVEAAAALAIGVQWHPEWHATTDPVSIAIFRAFSEAIR